MEDDRSLLDLVGLAQDLEELFTDKRRVGGLTDDSIPLFARGSPLKPVDCDGRAHLPGRQIAGMRDPMTHAYLGVDLGPIWRVVERDRDAVETAVTALIDSSRSSDRARRRRALS